MGEVKHTPGQRLFDACALAFDFRRTWANGNAFQHSAYERAASAFLASDPVTNAAPEMFEALKHLERMLAECASPSVLDGARAQARAAIAKATPTVTQTEKEG